MQASLGRAQGRDHGGAREVHVDCLAIAKLGEMLLRDHGNQPEGEGLESAQAFAKR